MSQLAEILSQFIAAWNAGERPRVDAFLGRVSPAERDELADQIETFLMLAPEPEYDEETWAAMLADPVAGGIAATPMGAEPWPSLLPRLRARAGLTIADVADRLGIRQEQTPKAIRLLEQMEAGGLDPKRPSRSLLERLGEILGVPSQTLDWRGGGAAPAPALYRAPAPPTAEQRLDLLTEGLLTDADEWDEVDELFLGGRE
jgi:transcriptional regulator with XRE-family HTH domain